MSCIVTTLSLWIVGEFSRFERGLFANGLVLLQIFQQGFRRPLVTSGAPVVVMLPPRVAQFSTLTINDVGLVDDGNASLRGHFVQSGQRAAPEAVHSV